MLCSMQGRPKSAISGAYATLGPQVAAAAKQERVDAGYSNAEDPHADWQSSDRMGSG